MRSQYIPRETFCFVCGHIIKEHQVVGNIEGVISHTKDIGVIQVDPFDGYLCHECHGKVAKHIEEGITGARRRTDASTKND